MRVRLVHTLSLLLLAAVLLAVLSMGGLTAWNLRNGFSEYLLARDLERLEQFAAFIGQRAERSGSMEGLRSGGLGLPELLSEFARDQGALPEQEGPPLEEGPPPPRDGRGLRPPPPPRRDGREHRPPPPRPRPPARDADAFPDRVAIYGNDARPLLGPGLPPEAGPWVERAVRVRGETVASVRMTRLRPVASDVESRFLTSQYLGIALLAGALLLLALACARWVALRWVRPLLEVQAATERIAHGEFDVRLGEARSDEIGDTMRNINRMAQGLQRLEGVRRRWVADISHELRTPLTVLRGEIEALVDGVRPLNAQAVLSLREEVARLSALVDDLHLLSLSDLQALPCHFEELDAVALVQKLVQRFALRASQLGLELRLDAAPKVECRVRWDARRVEQLLGNLLDNSLRYTDAPGKVSVTLQTSARHVLVAIEDSAPGVPEAELARVFEPLYRADAARSRHSGGSGLGLAICNAIALAHGATIQAKPSSLGGLRIEIELPWSAQAKP